MRNAELIENRFRTLHSEFHIIIKGEIMRTVLISLCCLSLLACGEKKDIKDTVFAPALQAKDKARAVEDKLKRGEEKNREALKASEQDAGADRPQKGY